MSKLTWHFQQLAGPCQADCANSAVEYVKIINPPETNPFPGKKIIGRTYMDDGDANAIVAMGAEGGERWFDLWEDFYATRPYVWAWEGPNEPQPIKDKAFRLKLNAFTIRWGNLMLGAGKRPIGWCISTGNLDVPEAHRPESLYEVDDLLPSLSHLYAIAFHEYGCPNVYDGATWHALRYRRQLERIWQKGYPTPKVFITECGVDGGILTPPRVKTGWRSFVNAEQYIEGLKWYATALQQDSYVESATVFTAGPNGDWQDFDVAGQVSEWMRDYSYQVPAVPAPQPTFLSALKAKWLSVRDLTDSLPKHPTKRYEQRDVAKITGIVLHHSTGSTTYTPEQAAQYHVTGNDWPGIGYHLWVARDGMVTICNQLETISYHAGNANVSTIGICLPGDYKTSRPTPEQISALTVLVATLRSYLGRELPVIGHCDVPGNATVCPGSNLLALVPRLNNDEREPLPEDEPDGNTAFLAEKVRWWQEQALRELKAGNILRCKNIMDSLVDLDNGLLYRLERRLKS